MKELLCVLTFNSWHRKCHSRQDNMGSLKCNFVVLTSNSPYQNMEVGKSGRFGEEPILWFPLSNTDIQKGEVIVGKLEINCWNFVCSSNLDSQRKKYSSKSQEVRNGLLMGHFYDSNFFSISNVGTDGQVWKS